MFVVLWTLPQVSPLSCVDIVTETFFMWMMLCFIIPSYADLALDIETRNAQSQVKDLSFAIHRAVGDASNFLFFPDIKRLPSRVADITWNGTVAGWIPVVAAAAAINRSVIVELEDQRALMALPMHLHVVPHSLRMVLIGYIDQNFGAFTVLDDERIVFWFVNQWVAIEHPKIMLIHNFVNAIWTRPTRHRQWIISILHHPRGSASLRTRLYTQGQCIFPRRGGYVLPTGNASSCGAVKENRCWKPYIDAALSSRMALSPPGLGFDCHRTYELLAAGVVPIVQHSTMDRMFAHLPVILVDDLEKAIQDIDGLERHYHALLGGALDLKGLTTAYWDNLVRRASIS